MAKRKKKREPSPAGSVRGPLPNPEFQKAMHGLGSSSAAQPHVPAPRKGTRAERARRDVEEGLQG